MNHINSINLSLSYFQFGPIIGHHKFGNDFISELNNRGKKSDVDHSHKLAGHILDEKEFSIDDKNWFMEKTKDVFLTYIETLSKNSLDEKSLPVRTLNLQNLWINFMKKGEFNPIHDHSGDISFVIYTSVPNEILLENKNFKGVGAGPGCISFYYGESSKSYKSDYHFLPKKGYMFLFPASLRHSVPPFMSDVTRTSVSGNIYFG